MAMNPRLLIPRATGYVSPDADARAYLAAVREADQSNLEPAVAKAISDFVVGCKTDGVWDAIKAACILAGAKTLAGALTPLKGSAPTNTNFVSGDYARATGLKGNGTDKVLNSNRNNNADPQNSKHVGLWITEATTVFNFGRLIAAGNATSGDTVIATASGDVSTYNVVCNNGGNQGIAATASTGFIGMNRSASASFVLRQGANETTVTATSSTPRNENIAVFGRPGESPLRYVNMRLAWYSIGESLDMGLLRSRLSTLVTAFGGL